MTFEPRLTLLRADLAAGALEGRLRAPAFADTTVMQTFAPRAGLHADPDPTSELWDQLLFGEAFEVLEIRNGLAFGQARRDGYVGYVPADALSAETTLPTHRIRALRTYGFARPDMKSPASGPFSMNALITAVEETHNYLRDPIAGWFYAPHLAPIGVFETEPASVTEEFAGAPYLWGGRDSIGLDCSGLILQAMQACGVAFPRDTRHQVEMGASIGLDQLRRGDLVFWDGHVGMMLDETRVIHANSFHMAAAIEPLAEARARISSAKAGDLVDCRRL